MLKFMKSFARDERGVTLVEYGIAIALANLQLRLRRDLWDVMQELRTSRQ